MLNKDLLKILVCPACKSPVKELQKSLICTNPECRRKYGIQDNIPVMLTAQAEVLSASAHAEAVRS